MPDIVRSYGEFVGALIARRKQLGWSVVELDARAGWTEGYATKLENWDGPQGRTASAVAMPLWLAALGIAFVPLVTVPGTLDEQARVLAAIRRPLRTAVDLAARPRRKKKRAKAARRTSSTGIAAPSPAGG